MTVGCEVKRCWKRFNLNTLFISVSNLVVVMKITVHECNVAFLVGMVFKHSASLELRWKSFLGFGCFFSILRFAFHFTVTFTIFQFTFLTFVALSTASSKTLTKTTTSNPSYERPKNTIENHLESTFLSHFRIYTDLNEDVCSSLIL